MYVFVIYLFIHLFLVFNVMYSVAESIVKK
jgi:hypothetical protein